jgi:hypothetical protein
MNQILFSFKHKAYLDAKNRKISILVICDSAATVNRQNSWVTNKILTYKTVIGHTEFSRFLNNFE